MSGDRETPRSDADAYREMAAELDRLIEAAERLQALGESADVPAVERTTVRLLGVAETLSADLPPELYEE